MFDKSIYTNRRSKLKQELKSGLLLFMGNEESPMNYTDNTYHFRQDSNFLYFFGINQAGLAAVIDIDNDLEIIFGDELTVDHIVWMGQKETIAHLADQVGVKDTRPYGDLPTYLQKAQSKKQTLHFLPPYRHLNTIKIAEWLNLPLKAIDKASSEAFIKAVIKQRSYKIDEELEQMEKALVTTAKMHTTAMEVAKEGMLESEITGQINGIAVGSGGGLAYPIILTVNGQILHNHYHGNVLQKGQLVLGDFGADTAMHYAGDITRTFPVAYRFSQQQRSIYQLVLNSQEAAIKALRPGITYKEVHLIASKVIANGLVELGLMKGDVEEAVEAGAHALFFPHGLGHMIGLDVHDMEDLGEDLVGYDEEIIRSTQFGLRSLRLGRKLETGFVLTVEPGIYFIPDLIDKWRSEKQFTSFINYDKLDAYRNFGGVRIEDNFVIRENGAQLLGPNIPKRVLEIEALRINA